MADTVLHEGELWHEFHRVVNMSAPELADWLHAHPASSDIEGSTEHQERPTGRQVLDILGKRQTDITSDDLQVMRGVIRRVNAMRRCDRGSIADRSDRSDWRNRLMSLGHDPLKPA
jgi:Protein of unknown function (DUF3140)